MAGQERRRRSSRPRSSGRAANELFGKAVAAGAASYVRHRDLPRLLPLWPHEIEDRSEAGSLRLLAKLRRALRAERRRARTGHWSYDLNRHLGLLSAYRGELACLVGPTPTRTAHAVAAAPAEARRGDSDKA